jgi:hypothetical protein
MKKIWKLLRQHVREDFHFWHYLSVAVILTLALAVNFSLDFEDNVLDRLPPFPRLLAFIGMYCVLYFLAVLSYSHWYKQKIFHLKQFWVHALFGIVILSVDNSVPFLRYIIDSIAAPQTYFWSFKVGVNAISLLTVSLPIVIFYFLYERRDNSIYGLVPKAFDVKPYFAMLALMLPFIIAVSFHQSFLNQYPMYRTSSAHRYLNLPEWFTAGVYEVAYALDFITVEHLFRGLFVLGMASFLGRGSVLCMAVLYCGLHFGKPLGEAVSSIFGGYILGVVAFETRSIWGGVIVHIGIAWSMELVAWIQKSL